MNEFKIKGILNKVIILLLCLCISFILFNYASTFAVTDSPGNDLDVYFYPLGTPDGTGKLDNYHTGDSCIIKSGDCEILIDGGSQTISSKVIKSKMLELCTDKIWEYIIVTHGDSDHILAFLNTKKNDGIFSLFKQESIPNDLTGVEIIPTTDPTQADKLTLEVIIDFDFMVDSTNTIVGKKDFFSTNIDDTTNSNGESTSKTNYDKYCELRNRCVAAGTLHYCASQCLYKERDSQWSKNYMAENASPLQRANPEWVNRLGRIFNNPRNPKSNFEINILKNKFCYEKFHNDNAVVNSYDRNNISVCTLITMNEKKFLFTGDLMEFSSTGNTPPGEEDYDLRVDGETQLYYNNIDYLKGGVDFFKAGHHGSRTSNSRDFMDFIRPNYIVIPCVAGSMEHFTRSALGEQQYKDMFPAQISLERMFKYTDHIYIPSYAVNTQDPDTKKWTIEAYTYYGDITISLNGQEISVYVSNPDYKDSNYKDGIVPIQHTKYLKEKRYDYFNVYTFETDDLMLSNCTLIKYGHTEILIDCGAEKVRNIDFVEKIQKYCVDGILEYVIVTQPQVESFSQLVGNRHKSKKIKDSNGIFSKFKIENIIDFGKSISKPENSNYLDIYSAHLEELIRGGTTYYNAPNHTKTQIMIDYNANFKIDILDNPWFKKNSKDNDNNSVCVLITYRNEKLLFIGDFTNEKQEEKDFITSNNLSGVTYFRASCGQADKTNGEFLLSNISPKYTVIAAPGDLYVSGLRMFGKEAYVKSIINYSTYVYMMSYKYRGNKVIQNGELQFMIKYTEKDTLRTTTDMICTGEDVNFEDSDFYHRIGNKK